MSPRSPHTVPFVTPDSKWSYGLSIPIEIPASSSRFPLSGFTVDVDISMDSGAAGLFLCDRETGRATSNEAFVFRDRNSVSLTTSSPGKQLLIVRNASDSGPTKGFVDQLTIVPGYKVDISDQFEKLLPQLLLNPGSRAKELVARTCGLRSGREVGRLKADAANAPIPFDYQHAFSDKLGDEIISASAALPALLHTYDVCQLDQNAGFGDRAYVERYLKQSLIRVYHLVDALRKAGCHNGKILEVGAFIGTFAIPLRRLGYEVTAIDRFRELRGGIKGYIEEMQRLGIDVVQSSEISEVDDLASLGKFDAVISMAVVEHIPHTPRLFLQALASHVSPGGVLALDTPNHVRFWNRKALLAGKSVHQPIEHQFWSGIPFGGHHREYTMSELAWMLEQIGGTIVHRAQFDYNVFQFHEMWPDHIDGILEFTVDPDLADTNLIAARFG